jgi:RNA polymerase primary sigma factor
MTLEAIGQRMGVTRERVRQIEASALQKLRRRLQARGIEWPVA